MSQTKGMYGKKYLKEIYPLRYKALFLLSIPTGSKSCIFRFFSKQ